ncbi:MAG: hypothetical protein CL946_10630 [Ectothiorhodospiraceae bacterium]|nr:hypothetical protein [Ectothiorhodospiraceae bacterium]
MRYLLAVPLLLFLFCGVCPVHAQGVAQAVDKANELLDRGDFDAIEDSLYAVCIIDILDRTNWRDQQLYVVGSRILEEREGHFLGHLLRGWYIANTATDRRGHERALAEYQLANANWKHKAFPAYKGNLDALVASQQLAGIDSRGQMFSYLTTYYYLQLQYQLSAEYLELDRVVESYKVMEDLREAGYAYDFYSLTRIAWIYYKYRTHVDIPEYTFLRSSDAENIEYAITLAKDQLKEIDRYKGEKYSYSRYWLDNSTTSWYQNASYNIISIAYGAAWQTDSSITYYEKMPDWFKLRQNGTYLYLGAMNYRGAERQFEYIGKAGGKPVEVLSEPKAIESQKNVLIYKGALDEAHFHLNNYPRKYQESRGEGMLWLGSVQYWRGDLDEAKRTLELALDYPEVFGNTSFTRVHYDMTAHAYLALVHEAMQHRFSFEPVMEDNPFLAAWEHVKRFFEGIYHWLMETLHRHWAIDKYLQIRDRNQYVRVFYTENAGDYFQTWSIIRHLDPAWHLDLIDRAAKDDKRPRAAKFYTMQQAGFLNAQGDYDRAHALIADFDGPLSAVDTTYEKLFIAMTEDIALESCEYAAPEETGPRLANLYRWYPQSAFLWGHRISVSIRESGIATLPSGDRAYAEQAMQYVQDFDFDFNANDPNAVQTEFEFFESEEGIAVEYTISLRGKQIRRGELAFPRDDNGSYRYSVQDAARLIAYSIYSIIPSTTENPNA